ncbi:uncharacterized protein B0P05DRAFT_529738 [Gilbertella persicaria]|uniref:Uncharacterized protein n=1 Tax=Rhizopus stolonifer TaxID=4846 RepID=A0A367IPQ9_RHIST|nr:uncharacterized protein B0P05DRAFT_529738 [Gilbertella persicaria]KAI8090198.1 hypothetical protein B0P05DRAFT_529738 [Gilbertella persicaria]RCH79677.1 hypothetical protein CU098_006796 [Rhizopus stolonifer]
MFTRLINTIREAVSKSPNNRNQASKHSSEHPSSEYSADSRRPSVTENCNDDVLSKFSQPNNSISEPIVIGSTANTGAATTRRRSSLFGISNVAYDDYVQKDLISSSWS